MDISLQIINNTIRDIWDFIIILYIYSFAYKEYINRRIKLNYTAVTKQHQVIKLK